MRSRGFEKTNNTLHPFLGYESRYRLVETIHGTLYDEVCVVKAEVTFPTQSTRLGDIVAVKCYKRPVSDRKMRHLRREILALKRVRSYFITALHEVFVSLSHICIVLEYAEGRTLQSYIKSHSTGMDETEARKIFGETLIGVRDLHSIDIVNRDIKPQNILYDSKTKKLKICDLGFARLISNECRTKLGTVLYLAPEIFELSVYNVQNECYDGKYVDVWSLGITLYFMLFGVYPFMISTKIHETEAAWTAMKHAIRSTEIKFPSYISPGCKNVLLKMLEKDPQRRVSINELLKDSWILDSIESHLIRRQYTKESCHQTDKQIHEVLHFTAVSSIQGGIDLTKG